MDHTGLPPYAPAPPYNAPQYPGQYPYGLSKAMLGSGMMPGGMGTMMMEGYSADNTRGPVMMGGAPPYSTSGSWSGRMSSGGGDGGVGRPWLQVSHTCDFCFWWSDSSVECKRVDGYL